MNKRSETHSNQANWRLILEFYVEQLRTVGVSHYHRSNFDWNFLFINLLPFFRNIFKHINILMELIIKDAFDMFEFPF